MLSRKQDFIQKLVDFVCKNSINHTLSDQRGPFLRRRDYQSIIGCSSNDDQSSRSFCESLSKVFHVIDWRGWRRRTNNKQDRNRRLKKRVVKITSKAICWRQRKSEANASMDSTRVVQTWMSSNHRTRSKTNDDYWTGVSKKSLDFPHFFSNQDSSFHQTWRGCPCIACPVVDDLNYFSKRGKQVHPILESFVVQGVTNMSSYQ